MELYSNFYFNHILFTIGALLITLLVSFICKKLIDLLFRGVKHRIGSERTLQKTRTIRNLLKNVLDATLLLIVFLIILSRWGIDIFPILTGASILGLAVSFGAQTFIKDLLAGFFIIFEDQYHIGDHVKIDKFEGEVYNITLRLTILRDKDNNMIYIPNSQVTTLVRFPSKPI